MGTQGTHENSIEDMVKWTLGHSKCERPATGGYHTLGSAVSQFGPYLKGESSYCQCGALLMAYRMITVAVTGDEEKQILKDGQL